MADPYAVAKEMYPILRDYPYKIVNTPDENSPFFLEHFPPGEPGSLERPRPKDISIDKYGLQIFKDVRPEDIAGDIISHHLVNEDEYLSEEYQKFKNSTPIETMESMYEYEKNNFGEERDFNSWLERTGYPQLLRGYVFNQFNEEEIDKTYNSKQKEILENIKNYVTKKGMNTGGDVNAQTDAMLANENQEDLSLRQKFSSLTKIDPNITFGEKLGNIREQISSWTKRSPDFDEDEATRSIVSLTPIVGDAMAAKEIYDELQKDNPNYLLVGALGGAAIIGLIPGIGDAAAAAIRTGARRALDVGKRIEIDPDAVGALGGNIRLAPKKILDEEMDIAGNPQLDNAEYAKKMSAFDVEDDMEIWKKSVKEYIADSRDVDPVVRTYPLEEAAQKFIDKEITREEYLKYVDEYKPVTGWDQLPREPSTKAMVYSLKPNQISGGSFVLSPEEAAKLGVKKSSLSIGDFFDGRLDVTAYKEFDTWIVAGAKTGEKGQHYAKAVHYEGGNGKPVILLNSDKPKKYETNIRTGERIGAAQKNPKGEIYGKTPYAAISGYVKDLDVDNIRNLAEQLLNDPEWIQLGFDPRRQGNFYVRREKANTPLHAVATSAEEVIQIGPLVLAKNPVLDLDYEGYKEGGTAMKDQMEMAFMNKDEREAIGMAEGGYKEELARKKLEEIRQKPTKVAPAFADTSKVLYGQDFKSLEAEEINKIGSLLIPFYAAGVNLNNVVGEYLKPEDERNYNYINSELKKAGGNASIDAAFLLGGFAGKYGAKGIKKLYQQILRKTKSNKKPSREIIPYIGGGLFASGQAESAIAGMQEGGLRDDGMEKDPVSGNEVPSGSMAKEVRDDVPAQLSEGEYVVPADVVRYYGVKFFEDLRNEAKMGMAKMEADGRIGGKPVPVGGPVNNEELSPEEMAAIQEAMGMAEGGVADIYQQQQNLYRPPLPQNISNPIKTYGNVQGYQDSGDVKKQIEQNVLGAAQTSLQNQNQSSPLGFSLFPTQAQIDAQQSGGTKVVLYSPEGVETVLFSPRDDATIKTLENSGYTRTKKTTQTSTTTVSDPIDKSVANIMGMYDDKKDTLLKDQMRDSQLYKTSIQDLDKDGFKQAYKEATALSKLSETSPFLKLLTKALPEGTGYISKRKKELEDKYKEKFNEDLASTDLADVSLKFKKPRTEEEKFKSISGQLTPREVLGIDPIDGDKAKRPGYKEFEKGAGKDLTGLQKEMAYFKSVRDSDEFRDNWALRREAQRLLDKKMKGSESEQRDLNKLAKLKVLKGKATNQADINYLNNQIEYLELKTISPKDAERLLKAKRNQAKIDQEAGKTLTQYQKEILGLD